jgi:vacuolar protein sorting-associated protein 1
MFTNDAEYIKTRTDIIPQNPPGQGEKSQKQLEPTNLYVLEMRARLDSYFKIVVRNVRDSIPKVIGYFLVKAVQVLKENTFSILFF